MIQVCSQCGTRWNVRDKQRSWCPRCNGTLLAPAATEPSPPASPNGSWGAGPAQRAAAATGLPMDRRAAGPAPTTPSPPPPARADPAVPVDSALGPAGSRRLGQPAPDGTASGAARRSGADLVLRVCGGAGRGRAGASAAIPAAGDQPQYPAELAGGRRGGAAQRVGQPGRDRGCDDHRLPADPLVDRPSLRGIRTCRAVGFPNAAGVVDRHAAAAVGRDRAGDHLCRGRGDDRALGQLGADGGLRDVQLSAPAGIRLGAGLRDRAGQDRRPLHPNATRSSGAGG